MKREDWVIEIRDGDLVVQGQVVEPEINAELLDNAPSSWSLSGYASPLLVNYLQNEGGILASYKGEVVFAGPNNGRVQIHESSGYYRFEATGQSDLVWTDHRVCQPSNFPFTLAEDVRTGAAENAAKAFVRFNMGSTAEAARQLPGLTVAPTLNIGTSGTWRGRMQPLGDLLGEIALQGGDLTFDLIQTDNGVLTFDMQQRRDVSSEVVFSLELGTSSRVEAGQLAAIGNVVYVGGDGEGSTRPFRKVSDAASISKWGRREKFITENSTVDTELDAKGIEELDKSAERFTGLVVPFDTINNSFIDDWRMGDIVGIEIDGVSFTQAVRKANLKITATSAQIVPLIGTPDTKSDDILSLVMDSLGRINSRIKNIERG